MFKIKEYLDIIYATLCTILGILFIMYNIWYLYVTNTFSMIVSLCLVCDGAIVCCGILRGLIWLKEAEIQDQKS